ncbi:unnamed protein product [Ectocarpus sp. 8 AP-2014]
MLKNFFRDGGTDSTHFGQAQRKTQYSLSASFAALHTQQQPFPMYQQPHGRREPHPRSSETNSIIACETFPFLSSSERSGEGDQVPKTHHQKQPTTTRDDNKQATTARNASHTTRAHTKQGERCQWTPPPPPPLVQQVLLDNQQRQTPNETRVCTPSA